MSRKVVVRITSILMIICLTSLLVPAQNRRRHRRSSAIGAGGAGTYVRKGNKPKGFLVNVEALPVRSRKARKRHRP